MKWTHVALGGLLLSTPLGCDTGGEDEGVPADTDGGGLTVGAYGPKVLEAREYLSRYGYFPNDALQAAFPRWQPMLPATTGEPARFDEGLQTALRKYQLNMGLTASGALDAATTEAMRAPRCGTPDRDPERSEQVDKWALVDNLILWPKTTITYRFNQPNVILKGTLTTAGTRGAINAGIRSWEASTNLTFVEVATGGDFLIDYRSLTTTGVGSSLPNPGITLNSSATFTPTTLTMAAAHEAGHVLGLHHSSRAVDDVTTRPLMHPIGNNGGQRVDDKIAANLLYNSWERLPGMAFDIGVGSDGTVWIIGHGDRQPHRWNGVDWGTAFTLPAGLTAMRIDVDPFGAPWVVTTSNRIYNRVNGSSWVEAPGGGRALDIGIGASSDKIHIIGSDGTVWRFVTTGWALVGGPTGSTSIDVDMAGTPFFITANREIWSCGGTCSRITAGGLGLDIGFGGPTVFTFNLENWGWLIGTDDSIWALNKQAAIPSSNPGSVAPARDGWVSTNGAARRISVGPQGRPWLVNASGNIYRRLEL